MNAPIYLDKITPTPAYQRTRAVLDKLGWVERVCACEARGTSLYPPAYEGATQCASCVPQPTPITTETIDHEDVDFEPSLNGLRNLSDVFLKIVNAARQHKAITLRVFPNNVVATMDNSHRQTGGLLLGKLAAKEPIVGQPFYKVRYYDFNGNQWAGKLPVESALAPEGWPVEFNPGWQLPEERVAIEKRNRLAKTGPKATTRKAKKA